ncbi:mRNA export factor Gle1 [Sabethes cyaneus]|uniref:mRNA export factor Gle1 n=1 Tax=Sabethes cyaneus TaxID=53552 RepID=UPI00237E6E10|nr:mRNA export factor Gle1 [Sabethes cyaneus]
MSNISFNVDDLLADFHPLKISALCNAARISPLIKGCTIGPNSTENGLPKENDSSLGNEADRPATVSKKHERAANDVGDRLKYVPDLTVTVRNPARRSLDSSTCSARRVDISDCRAISVKLHEQELELTRKKEMRKEMERRQARIREADRHRDLIHEDRIRRASEEAARRNQEYEQKILEASSALARQAEEYEKQRKAEIDRENRRMAEVSLQLKLKQEEIKRRHAMFNAILEQQATFRKMTEVFNKTLLSVDKEYLGNFASQNKSAYGLVKAFEQLFQSVRENKEVKQEDVDRACELCKSMEQTNTEVFDIKNRLQQEIAERIKKDEEQQQAQAAGKQQPQPAEAEVAPPSAQDTTDTNSKVAPSSNEPHPLAAFVSRESLAFYSGIKSFYEQHQAAVKVLLDDANMKSYRFNCQKVINTPVNAISAVSREHFVDKFQRLDALLAGHPVKIGDAVVSIDGHPLGRTYCTMLLAKKFVSQADTMISSNAPAAFPIAAIIVALWQRYPDFGRFFLAYLHKECPYLVPYFLPQLEGQSHEDYFKSIGYRYSSDGTLEQQDQYLKRMTGLVRLYSAVIVSNPRRGETAPHPHSLECGWRWLCSILNLQPLPDICATLITEFLAMAGGLLWAHYGKQFVKVLRVLQQQYLPALNKVDEGGPKARLEGLIAKITAEGRIDRPEGMLSSDFW